MDDNNSYPYAPEPEASPAPASEAAPGQAAPQASAEAQQPPYAYSFNPQGYPPAYAPQGYYSAQPSAQPQAPPPPQAPPKKSRAGLVALSVFAVLAVVVGVFVGVGIYRYSDVGTAQPGATQKDNSKLQIAETPSGKPSTPAAGAVLTPVQVHDKLRESNVAVQLYSGRGGNSMVGEGSGVILHEDSTKTYTYVLTAAHVISSNERVSVELADGTSYDAAIVGFDSRTDVGLLRVKATGLHGAVFGDSDKLQVGEAVYAIGNPGGAEFKGSFTNGIVSAIERPITSRYTMQTIQHTAPINPGNSGGALVNAYGQVVGINSQKIVDASYEGMGFAIPSKVVQDVVNNLIGRGYVPDRPKLGIQYIAASQTQRGMLVMRINDLPSGSLIIARIDEDSDITGTDIKTNDLITHVNGKPLDKADVLLSAVEKGKVGEALKLSIARVDANFGVETFEVSVKLVEDKGTAPPAEEETRPWYEDEAQDDYGQYSMPPGFPFDW